MREVKRFSSFLLGCLFLGSISIPSLIPHAAAFDSFPKWASVHDEITDEALKDLGFSEEALDRVKYAARNQDWSDTTKIPFFDWLNPSANYGPEHHCDRNKAATTFIQLSLLSHEAFDQCAEYANAQAELFKAKMIAGSTDEALDALGRALHALEDLFSHSNFVDLSDAEQAATLDAFGDPAHEAPPLSLLLTYYPGYKQNRQLDEYDHDRYNKDARNRNPEAKSKVTTANKYVGMTKFEAAKKAATDYKRTYVETLKAQLGEGVWGVLATYGLASPDEIPAGYHFGGYRILDAVWGTPVVSARIVQRLSGSQSMVSESIADAGGEGGWYFPENSYYIEVSAYGYYPFVSDSFVLNTDAVLDVSLTPLPSQENTPAVAWFGFSPESPIVGQRVDFDGSLSYDPDAFGAVARYWWYYGDGYMDTGMFTYHFYESAGDFEATLRLLDNSGATSVVSSTVSVRSPDIGGLAEAPDADASTLGATASGGSSGTTYAVIAGIAAAAVLLLAAGGRYARWRWRVG